MLRKTLLILAVMVVVLAAAVWYDYSREIAAARARVSNGSTFIRPRCGAIERALAGPAPASPAFLTIHAARGASGRGPGRAS